MALWDSITNTTTIPAAAFTKVLNKRSADTAMSVSPLLRKIWGDQLPEGATPFDTELNQTNIVTGGKGEIEFRGALMTVSAVTTQTTSVSNNYSSADFASATFDLTHYNVMAQIGIEELTYIQGQQAKFNYLDRKMTHILDSVFAKVATDFHSTGDQAKAQVGSWRLAIQTDDTNSTYLGIARATSANSGLRGNVDSAGTALTIARIEAQVNAVAANGGCVDLGILGTANFGVLQGLIEGQRTVMVADDKWAQYGGRYLDLGGTKFALDSYCAATQVGLIDSSSWCVSLNQGGLMASDMFRHPTVQSINVLPVDLYVAIVTDSPRTNARIVTS